MTSTLTLPASPYEFSYRVARHDCADFLALEQGDAFPQVLATNRVVGLLEVAAARLMRDALPEGHFSVGVGVDIRHVAPTPIGAVVRFHAEFVGMQGRLYEFVVTAVDHAGVAAEGRHTRAVVSLDRLMGQASKRATAGG
ncbi:thioesterase family protein [Ramlibacter pallidus]|uniref:Thioesterase n=1 Tax=Ramlibacter pallidus TaxID=2780087 RepID=A0ABR9S613_9BURK|nr:thioesterase [Ramlibacter pallidus]MBE7368952.1 thioesterase [Ramlibacter pallidus]